MPPLAMFCDDYHGLERIIETGIWAGNLKFDRINFVGQHHYINPYFGESSMLNKDIYDALLSGEFGDARSYLDEYDPTGLTSINELNKINPNALWLFDEEDGWGYDEI